MKTDDAPRPERTARIPVAALFTRRGLAVWAPWALLAAVVAAGLFLLDRHARTPETATVAPASTPAAAIAAPVEAAAPHPRLRIDSRGGLANVNGQLAEADKARLDAALARVFGADSVRGDIGGDAATADADWLDGLIALLPDLKARGFRIAIEGERAKVDLSALPAGTRATLSGRIRAAFAGRAIDGLEDEPAAVDDTPR